jgi:hypothetical protein
MKRAYVSLLWLTIHCCAISPLQCDYNILLWIKIQYIPLYAAKEGNVKQIRLSLYSKEGRMLGSVV